MIAPTVRLDPTLPLTLVGESMTGPVRVEHLGVALGTSELYLNVVYFAAGARTRPHLHNADQVLYYQGGAGVVALDGGEDQRVEAGTAVLLPAGIVHMHGAAQGGAAWHLSIMADAHGDFDCPVPESWRTWRP